MVRGIVAIMGSSLLGLLLAACGGTSAAEPTVAGTMHVVAADAPSGECFPRVEGDGSWIEACYQARRIADVTDPDRDYYALSMHASAEVSHTAGAAWVEAVPDPDGPALSWPASIPAASPFALSCEPGVGPGLTCGAGLTVGEAPGSVRSQWSGRGDGSTAGVEFETIVAVAEGERPAWVLSWGVQGCEAVGGCEEPDSVASRR